MSPARTAQGKEASSFFEKKEAKKLLSTWFRAARPVRGHEPKRVKVFCFFFSKKQMLGFRLSSLPALLPR
jgi:hypothetical protein